MKVIKFSLIGIWFTACSAFILWMGSANKTEFDPYLSLSQAIMNVGFEDSFIKQLKAQMPVLDDGDLGYLVHFTQDNCYCEWLANTHRINLDQWAKQNQFSIASFNVERQAWLKSIIPSTPAVLAFDNNDNLIYFGPYSRGGGCFTSSGEIDVQLSDWIAFSDKSRFQGVIDTDATGCYCGILN